MQKYLAACASAVLLFSSLGMAAQLASGNVAESAHPRTDVLQAQNPRIHRSVEGCLVQQDGEYILNSEHTGAIRLRAVDNASLSQHLSQRVKVRGDLTPTVVQGEENEGASTNVVREMAVERLDSVAGSCPKK